MLGMGNSPTRIAIAYKSGGRRGISPLEYGGLKLILPIPGERSDAACRVVFWPSCLPPIGIYGFYNDAARRVATVFEKWDCEINPDKRLNHTGLFPCLPFWNTAVYNPFSRFSEDVATRRAASLSSFTPPTYRNLRSLSRCVVPRRNKNHTSPCVAWYAAWRRWQWAALGAMRIALPTVGAGSSQREDSPAHRLPHRPHRRILSRASATPIYTPWLG